MANDGSPLKAPTVEFSYATLFEVSLKALLKENKSTLDAIHAAATLPNGKPRTTTEHPFLHTMSQTECDRVFRLAISSFILLADLT
eukprot:SAG31_NODE_762_length_12275_cov_14.077119_3_plen_86_part_00